MQFTTKEIELSKQLKEAGLEWKPEGGDWFLLVYPRHVEVHLCIDVEFSGTLLTWLWDEHPQYSVARHDVKDCVWLPLWHQCREFLAKKGWFIGEHYDSTNIGQASLWIGKKGLPDFDTNFKRIGETDLEAMYKVLLEVIKNVNDE